MNQNSIREVAKTYQRLVEAAPPESPFSGLFDDPNYNPNIPDPPPLAPQDVLPDLLSDKPVPPGHQARIEEIQRILRSFDNTPSNGSGRAKSIQMAVAALIAAGALIYLTYEDLMQMVEDYFNPPIQPPYVLIHPQYHNPYVSPYQQMINNLGSEQGGYIPGGIFGP